MHHRLIRYVSIPLLLIAAAALVMFFTRHVGKPRRTVAEAEKPQVYVQQGHGEPVWCLAWSPDGKQALSGAQDGKVILWDVRAERELYSLQAHAAGGVVSVAFLPDGARFVTASTDSTVRIWDVNTMLEVKRFRARGAVTSISLSADGDRLLCTALDSIATLWDIPSGKLLRRFVTNPLGSTCSALSPNGDLAVLQGRQPGTITLWDANSGKQMRELVISETTPIGISFSHNGSEILCVSGSGREFQFAKSEGSWSIGAPRSTAYGGSRVPQPERTTFELWSAKSGQRIRCFGSDAVGVTSMQMMPDDKRLFTAGIDSTMELWDIESGRLLRELPNIGSMVSTAAVSSDGRSALAAGWGTGVEGNHIGVWDIEQGRCNRVLQRNALTAFMAVFAAEGEQIRVGWFSGVYTWDVHTARRLSNFIPDPRLRQIGRSADYSCGFYAVETPDPDSIRLQFWSLDNGLQGMTEKAIQGFPYWDFSRDGRYCLTGTSDSLFTLWDVPSGRELNHFIFADSTAYHGKGLCSDCYLYDKGRRAVARHCMPDLCLFDFVTNQKQILRNPNSNADVFSLFYLFDDERVSASRADGTVEFWDTRTARLLRSFKLDNPLDYVTLSADEKVFAGKILQSSTSEVFESGKKSTVETWNGTVVGLWDAATGRKIRDFVGHTGFVNLVGISPDTRILLSSATDGTTRLWNIQTGKEIVRLVSFINDEWIAVTPEGYYTASINGDAYLNVRVGTKVTGIDQYRSTFYQPAVVEAALRLRDSELAISEVLGCKDKCTTLADVPDMQPPVLKVQHPVDGDTLKSVDTTLAFHLEDRRNPIALVRVFVNGRPIRNNRAQSSEGINLAIPKDQSAFDLSVPLTLDEGDNLITITALGRSEVVDTLHVYVRPQEELAEKMDIDTVWILAVGVNKYQDKTLHSLNYCVNDAQGVVQAFKAQEGKACRKVMSRLITDTESLKPTAETIMDNIRFLHQAKPEDLVILFLAGHGMKNARGDFYFMPADAEMLGPHEFNTSRAISGAQLQWAVEVPARRFVFVDACHSGDVGVDLVKLVREFKDDRVLIMTSSEGNKPSEEADSLKHGLFSYALIRGLQGEADITGNDGKVSATELIAYVIDKVSTLTQHRQNPYFWAPGGLSNFVVAAGSPHAPHMVATRVHHETALPTALLSP